MKSKTSCFNTTIFKKNISHYWPVWGLFLCYLLLILPVNIWLAASNKLTYISLSERQNQIIGSAISVAITPAPIFLFAVMAAIVVFYYLYTAKNANMIHALPVNRLELFVTNYISGILFLLIPELVAFVAAVMVCMANQITCMEYLLEWLLDAAGISFFAYSLAVFVGMFTGLSFAMPLYFFIVNYLYVGCLSLVHIVRKLLLYGLMDSSWKPGESCILSPLYYLSNNLRARVVSTDSNGTSSIKIYGSYLAVIYAVAAVVFTVAAYRLYKKRQIENAGDFVSIGIVRPIFRWGVAFCGGIALAEMATCVLKEELNIVEPFPYLLVSTLIFSGICFWLAEMLLRKNFKVFCKKRFAEWAVLAVVSVGFLMFFEADVLGTEKYLPEAEEIEAAFVNMDYPMQIAQENIEELLTLHEDIIRHKKEYLKNAENADGKYYYTTIRYYLKDGSLLERRYQLPVTEQYLCDASSPSAKIIAWEKDSRQQERQILGMDYETNECYEADIELFSKTGESMIYYFQKEEIEQLLEAVRQDIEEGNFNAYILYSEQQEKECYANMLNLNYISRNKSYSLWYYFDHYRECNNTESETENSRFETAVSDYSSYIPFGADCIHTVALLENLGVVNDKWQLYTYAEKEKLN